MLDDAELLRRYAEEGSAGAFDELARRHVDLVYSAALRQTGGQVDLAKDVTQMVLIDLARKARSLRGRPSIVGWLYTATRYAAVTLMRSEHSRRARETASAALQAAGADAGSDDAHWEAMRPVLDEALAELKEVEREAVLLRFFKGCSYADIGRALALTETAARSRVDRALERLRVGLSRRGIQSTPVALGAAMLRGATATMPAEFAAGLIGAAVAAGVGGAAAGAGSMLAGGKGAAVLAEFFAMKLSTGALILSLAANLALGAVYYTRSNTPGSYERFADISMAPVQRPGPTEAAASSATASRDLFAATSDTKLDLTDQATLIRKMEADGFDRDDIARAIVGLHAHLSRPWMRELEEARWAKAQRWRLTVDLSSADRDRFKERDSKADAAVAAAGYGPEPANDFPGLSKDKAAMMQRIVKDYAELSGSSNARQIRWDDQGRRKGDPLWPEFEKDVRAVLSPEEARQYLRSNSPAAQHVQNVLQKSPELDLRAETYGSLVDDVIAGTSLPTAFRRQVGDERLLTLMERINGRAATLDGAYRAAGFSVARRADLFVQGSAFIDELQAASEAARPAIARRAYEALVVATGLQGAQLDMFHTTRMGGALREMAAQPTPATP